MQTTQKPDESTWSEARLQAECFQWHYNTYPAERGLLFTVDNNANDGVKGAVRKAMGRVAGVSDMIYLCPNGYIYFIELKLPSKNQSPAQKNWQKLVETYNFRYHIAHSLAEFQQLIHDVKDIPF